MSQQEVLNVQRSNWLVNGFSAMAKETLEKKEGLEDVLYARLALVREREVIRPPWGTNARRSDSIWAIWTDQRYKGWEFEKANSFKKRGHDRISDEIVAICPSPPHPKLHVGGW